MIYDVLYDKHLAVVISNFFCRFARCGAYGGFGYFQVIRMLPSCIKICFNDDLAGFAFPYIQYHAGGKTKL